MLWSDLPSRGTETFAGWKIHKRKLL
uniref:Uncharacterized protein n=1 Tax=Homo sapiens TaxID=9606 RepID=A0A8V8TND5_HUMAN